MARLSVVIAVLLAFTTGAWAGGKVDWSKYIDPNPSAPVRSPVVASKDEPPPKATKAKASKASKKKATPKRKAKARAKAKSRR